MFCPYCGMEVPNDAVYCANCGATIDRTSRAAAIKQTTRSAEGTPEMYQSDIADIKDLFKKPKENNFWWGLLSFLIPLVGIILFFAWRTQYPARAKVCLIWGIIGFICNFLIIQYYPDYLSLLCKS